MPIDPSAPHASGASLRASQADLLLSELIANNRGTRFGIEHRFESIQSVDDFRARVPLTDYEGLRPWVDRISDGQQNVLTGGRVLAFFKTSGSLAKPKLIPVTTELMRQKVGVFADFWEGVYRDHPRVRHGKMVSNFSDASEPEAAPSGLKIYSESGFWARRGRGLHTLDRWPLPKEVRDIKDPWLRSYACARLLLQEDMTCIMCLNPSTLLHFCRTLHEQLPSLAAGLESGDWGTIEASGLDSLRMPAHDALSAHLRADPTAAERLRAYIPGGATPVLGEIWPSLDLIICWRSKIVEPYFEQLSGYTRGVAIRDYITQSSECMMAIPFRDSTSGGLLAHAAHFFEFIPEASVDRPQPDTLLSWQLQAGERYEVVVTTGGGLYRYRMGDCIQVNGFQGAVPIIEFLYRFGRTSSITGEKLTEHQVLQAARTATAELGHGPDEFLCFPCSGKVPHYSVALDYGPPANGDERARAWGEIFERQLRSFNTEYADKCDSARLGTLKTYRVTSGHLKAVRSNRRASGVSEEQVKSEVLTSDLDIHRSRLSVRAIS